MSTLEDNWTPSENEIDEALSLYDSWLAEAFKIKGSRDEAFHAVNQSFNEHPIKPIFFWITENTPDRLYDIDETLPEQ